MKTIAPVVAAVALALALVPASAEPKHQKRHAKAATAAQPQIACTVVGCIPGSTRLPSRDGLHAGRDTNRF